MINAMNNEIRKAVRIELAKRDMNQTELAEALGMSKQHLNRALSGDLGKLPPVWAKILDYLGLELVVVPKAEGQKKFFNDSSTLLEKSN
jgi:transcriptional regulator with XRE-family HTH domain